MKKHSLALTIVTLCWMWGAAQTKGSDPAQDPLVVPPPAHLALELKRGISIDRQFRTIPPESIMRFTREDIRLIKSMGFEFVKLIVNPEPLLSHGRLDATKQDYLGQIISQVTAEGLPVVVCIHPEWEFKRKILGDRAEFAQFLLFLQDVGVYLAERWSPQQLAWQLMTEPVTESIPWNELQPQMWQVARRAMPGHTLILAGDQVGKIEGLITTEPVNDENVLYSFTFYDPFLFTLQGAPWLTPAWWSHLGPVPYPSSPELIAAQMPNLLGKIPAEPPEWRTTVAQHLQGYGAQRWNPQTLATRIQMLDHWNKSHGGRLKIWCAEFGCFQRTVTTEDRNHYLQDVRTAFETYGIGWAYWSYNETLTAMTPDRTPFGPADRQTPDQTLLRALGVQ